MQVPVSSRISDEPHSRLALLEQVTVLIGIAYRDRAIAGIIHQPYYNQKGRTVWAIEGCGVNGLTPAGSESLSGISCFHVFHNSFQQSLPLGIL